MRADGAAAEAQAIDVGDIASIDSAFADIERRHGRCDVLVNSAGIARVYPFLEFPADNFVATMTVNVTGTFLCSAATACTLGPEMPCALSTRSARPRSFSAGADEVPVTHAAVSPHVAPARFR